MNPTDDILDYDEKFIEPAQYLASKGSRFANYVLDRIFVYIFISSLSFLLLFITPSVNEDILIVLILLIVASYWIIPEYLWGKTLAKWITKSKVVTRAGQKPGFWQIVGRNACRLIPFEPFSFLGKVPIGWHDSFSYTMVVQDSFEGNDEFDI